MKVGMFIGKFKKFGIGWCIPHRMAYCPTVCATPITVMGSVMGLFYSIVKDSNAGLIPRFSKLDPQSRLSAPKFQFFLHICQCKLVVNIKKWVDIKEYKYVYLKLVLTCWEN